MTDGGRGSVRRLALARVLSATGSWAGGLALPFVLFQITGSGVWVAASWFITFGITGLLSPLSGTIADRFDRRRVIRACMRCLPTGCCRAPAETPGFEPGNED